MELRDESVKDVKAARDKARAARIAAGLWDVIAVRSDAMAEYSEQSNEEPSKDQIRSVFLALVVETIELLNEFDWKPWKKGKQSDSKKIAHEFADILAFLAILMVYLMRKANLSPIDLADAYVEKMDIVGRRMRGEVDGYEAESGSFDA